MAGQTTRSNTTVRDVLQLVEVQVGEPQIIAGEHALEREIRWAHVAADSLIASAVDGGELVLMTANAWPSDPALQHTFTEELIAAGISALALELGQGLDEAPAEMVASCQKHNVPLIVFPKTVRFVQITQRLHQRILAEQYEALTAREQVHTMLTELGLNRSPVDYVVERLAATIAAPVVLQDPAGRVVAVAEQGADLVQILNLFTADVPAPQHELPEGSVQVAVEARGTRWGTLTALPGPAHPAGRSTVLELGAFALALGRISGTDNDQWLQQADRRMFESLLSGRYRNHTEIEAQLAAAQMPFEPNGLLVFALSSFGAFGSHSTLEHTTIETALRRAIAPDGHALIAEFGDATTVSLLALVSAPQHLNSGERIAAKVAAELEMLVPNTTPPSWRVALTMHGPVTGVPGLVASLEQLREQASSSNTMGSVEKGATQQSGQEFGRVLLRVARQNPLAHLILSLKGTPQLNEFATEALAPLIDHDAQTGPGHSGDLMRVLAAALAHPSNRSRAAAEARLSRSVFYQRIELIEDLLGLDLTDGNTIATLTVAMLARQPLPSSKGQ